MHVDNLAHPESSVKSHCWLRSFGAVPEGKDDDKCCFVQRSQHVAIIMMACSHIARPLVETAAAAKSQVLQCQGWRLLLLVALQLHARPRAAEPCGPQRITSSPSGARLA